MIELLGILMNNRNSLKVIRDDRDRESTLGIPIYTIGGVYFQYFCHDIVYHQIEIVYMFFTC